MPRSGTTLTEQILASHSKVHGGGELDYVRNSLEIDGVYDLSKQQADQIIKKLLSLDDEKWRMILRGLNKKFYHQTVESKQIEDYISLNIGFDLSTFFNQYLRDIRIPNFEYRIEDGVLTYRWVNVIEKFTMPLEIEVLEKKIILYPETTKKSIKINSDKIKINRNYYVNSVKIN